MRADVLRASISERNKKTKKNYDACKWLTLSEAAGGKGGRSLLPLSTIARSMPLYPFIGKQGELLLVRNKLLAS